MQLALQLLDFPPELVRAYQSACGCVQCTGSGVTAPGETWGKSNKEDRIAHYGGSMHTACTRPVPERDSVRNGFKRAATCIHGRHVVVMWLRFLISKSTLIRISGPYPQDTLPRAAQAFCESPPCTPDTLVRKTESDARRLAPMRPMFGWYKVEALGWETLPKPPC